MKKILSLVLVLATLLSCVSLAAADETVKSPISLVTLWRAAAN